MKIAVSRAPGEERAVTPIEPFFDLGGVCQGSRPLSPRGSLFDETCHSLWLRHIDRVAARDLLDSRAGAP